jgi:hypothetical protein
MYSPTNDENTPNSGLETVNRGNTVANYGAGPTSNSNWNNNVSYINDPKKLANTSYIKYQGAFVNGQKSGYGRATYPDGSVYNGYWSNDLPSGKGKLQNLSTIPSTNEYYEGDWVDGQMSGLGFQQWKDGSSYKGGFLAGRKHGNGSFSWPDGNRYDGSYKDDLRDGFGTFIW